MTAKDGICDGRKDIGLTNCVNCVQRREREAMDKAGHVEVPKDGDVHKSQHGMSTKERKGPCAYCLRLIDCSRKIYDAWDLDSDNFELPRLMENLWKCLEDYYATQRPGKTFRPILKTPASTPQCCKNDQPGRDNEGKVEDKE